MVNERLMILPMLAFILWFASVSFSNTIKSFVATIFIIFSVFMLFKRLPYYADASKAVEEYMSVDQFIDENSIILPLDFNHNGNNLNGENIADRIWIFTHAADYLGAEKPLIILDNYEANTGYFPFLWIWERNPFDKLSKNEGIEFQPPCVDIPGYENKTGEKIDYVLLLNFSQHDTLHPYTQDLLKQLDEVYVKTYTSENERAILFKHI